MILVFEKLSQNLGGGYLWKVGIAGEYLRLAKCQWPVTVLLYRRGSLIGQMQNMLAGDYVDGVGFDSFEILNGGVGQVVDVQISGGGAGSNRVMGEVSVISGEISRVVSGLAFIGYAGCTGVAGNYSHNQLWNPAGSGKNVIVSKISVLPSGASSISLASSVAALSALKGAAGSKKLGGAAPSSEMRGAEYAAVQGSPLGNFSITGGSNDFPFSEPILVPPGYGLIVSASALAINLYTTYQWFEEPI